jgi:hypothetical protein
VANLAYRFDSHPVWRILDPQSSGSEISSKTDDGFVWNAWIRGWSLSGCGTFSSLIQATMSGERPAVSLVLCLAAGCNWSLCVAGIKVLCSFSSIIQHSLNLVCRFASGCKGCVDLTSVYDKAH